MIVLKEANKFFKGKTIRSLMRFKPGNAARNFYKTVKLPLVPQQEFSRCSVSNELQPINPP